MSFAVTTPIDRRPAAHPLQLPRARPWATRRPPATSARPSCAEVDKQFLEDKPIWEHKAHLVRPALADNDGPFMKFRKWAAQFYAEGVSDERTVFPPPVVARPRRRGAGQGHGQRQARRRLTPAGPTEPWPRPVPSTRTSASATRSSGRRTRACRDQLGRARRRPSAAERGGGGRLLRAAGPGVVAVEPSPTMIGQRAAAVRPVIRGVGRRPPLRGSAFVERWPADRPPLAGRGGRAHRAPSGHRRTRRRVHLRPGRAPPSSGS